MQSLPVGTRIRVRSEINLEGFARIAAGEQGTVTVSAECGTWVTADKRHPGLAEYQNAFWLDEPWCGVDYLDCIETVGYVDVSVAAATFHHLSPELTVLFLRLLHVLACIAGGVADVGC